MQIARNTLMTVFSMAAMQADINARTHAIPQMRPVWRAMAEHYTSIMTQMRDETTIEISEEERGLNKTS